MLSRLFISNIRRYVPNFETIDVSDLQPIYSFTILTSW